MTAQAHYHPGTAFRLLLAVALLAITSIAAAAEPVGRVISTTGTVTAVDVDDQVRAISRNDVVFPGETIRTAPRARVQIRFIDDALVALRPRTHFEIEDYGETDDDSGNAVMNLVQGALRAISGRIGNRANDEYRMNTPTATVGIRGTDYSLQYCDADCAGDGRREGTYGRVNEGTVEVSNAFGSLELDGGTYFFIPDDGPPEVLLVPPDGILDDVDEGDDDGVDDGDGPDLTNGEDLVDAGGDFAITDGGDVTGAETFTVGEDTSAEIEDSETREPDENGDEETLTDYTGHVTAAFAGSGDDGATSEGGSFFSPDQEEAQVDEQGRLVRVNPDSADPVAAGELDARDMTGEELEVTTIAGTDIDVLWGRWSGSFEFQGTAYTGGVVWALVDAADMTTADQLAEINGVVVFGNPQGPAAVGDDGSLWSVDEFTLGVDFNEFAVAVDSLELSEEGGEVLIAFNGVSDASFLDTETAQFFVSGDQDGYFLFVQGSLIGEQAEGAVATIDIDSEDLGIIGVQILESLADAELQEFELESTLAYGLLGEFTEPNGTTETADRNVIDNSSHVAFIDSLGRLVRVVEDQVEGGDLTTEFDGMTHVDAGSLDALEARWGRWTDGTITRTDSFGSTEIDGDYMYAYSELDLTTPERLGELTATYAYEHAGGPMAVSDVGNEWSVQALEIVFDFGGSFGQVNQFDLERADGLATVELDSGGNELNLENWNFNVTGSWFDEGGFAGDADGQINGRFIGTDADGALYTFDVDLYDDIFDANPALIESILGTGVLEQGEEVLQE